VHKIDGHDVYVSPAPSGDKTRAVLFVHDIYSYHLVNTRLLADHYAKEIDATVYIPHFFITEAAPLELLKDPSLWQTWNFQKFLADNNKELVYPAVTSFAKHLKEKEGVKKLGAIGFCYGGWATLQLSRDHLVDVIATAHPTWLDFPKDVENINHPAIFLCAEIDQIFPKENVPKIEEILKSKPFPHKVKLYPGVQHGFSLRGDATEEHVRESANDAAAEAISFFVANLK